MNQEQCVPISIDRDGLYLVYIILQNISVMHAEEPEVEPICSDKQLQAAFNTVEDGLGISAARRWSCRIQQG